MQRVLLQSKRPLSRTKSSPRMSKPHQGRAASLRHHGNGVTKRTAVVIVDHGSRRAEANALLHRVVSSFQDKTQIAVVEPAHMEIQKPDIADALCACVQQGAEHVVISPFFLSPGRHSQRDIPRLVEEAISEHEMQISYSIADPIGTDPLIVDILHQRVTSALNGHSKQN